MPFLSIVTRCYRRPAALARNVASVQAQVDPDLEHLFIVDDVGRGVQWANAQFAVHAGRVHGEYVLMLDDDDALATSMAIVLLKQSLGPARPDLVVFRADHGPLGILPGGSVWGQRPARGQIGGIDFITRADVWRKHIKAFARPADPDGPTPCGDYSFLEAVWKRRGLRVAWLDRLLTRVQGIGRGEPE